MQRLVIRFTLFPSFPKRLQPERPGFLSEFNLSHRCTKVSIFPFSLSLHALCAHIFEVEPRTNKETINFSWNCNVHKVFKWEFLRQNSPCFSLWSYHCWRYERCSKWIWSLCNMSPPLDAFCHASNSTRKKKFFLRKRKEIMNFKRKTRTGFSFTSITKNGTIR